MHSRNLAELTKEEKMEMFPKNVVDIRMLSKDDDKLMGLPIMALEFEKDILKSHIIIRGESIQLRMKKQKPSLCERCLQFRHPKSSAEATGNCAEPL